MVRDEAFFSLCKGLAADSGIMEQQGWKKLILRGQIEPDVASMHGCSFDGHDNCLPIAPSSAHAIDLLREFQEAMEEADPSRGKWIVCLMRISHDDKVDVDFEYQDANRWKFGFDDYMNRMQELAAAPIHGAGPRPDNG